MSERSKDSITSELPLPSATSPARKLGSTVLALLFVFATEVLDGAVMALGQPPEYRLEAALISAGVLLLLALATYGVHHRAKWGMALAVGIACVTLGFSIPTLLVGNLTINGVLIDQTPLARAVGWTKMGAYGLFLFLLIRDRLSTPVDRS